jgi:hypothetical protein
VLVSESATSEFLEGLLLSIRLKRKGAQQRERVKTLGIKCVNVQTPQRKSGESIQYKKI